MNEIVSERVLELVKEIQKPIYSENIMGSSIFILKLNEIINKYRESDITEGFNEGLRKLNI
mgnify:CR=1 FL=1